MYISDFMKQFKTWILVWILCFQCCQACDQVLQSRKGTFHSPGVTTYPSNASCTWEITSNQQAVITITFDHFDLENSTDCEKDFVQITYSDGSKMNRLCGHIQTPFSVITDDNSVQVAFTSDDSVERSGFKASYKVVSFKKIIPQMLKGDRSARYIDAAGRIMRAHQLDAANPLVRIYFTEGSRLYQHFVDYLNKETYPPTWFRMILKGYGSLVQGRAMYHSARQDLEFFRLPFFINSFVREALDNSLNDRVKMMVILKNMHKIDDGLLFSERAGDDLVPLYNVLKNMFMEIVPVLGDLQQVYHVLPELVSKKSLIPYIHLSRIQQAAASLITRLRDNLWMTRQHVARQVLMKRCFGFLQGTGCTLEKIEELQTLKTMLLKVLENRSGASAAETVNTLLSGMDKVINYKQQITTLIDNFIKLNG